MKRAFVLVFAALACSLTSACNGISLSVLTQAPATRTLVVDDVTSTLTISRGLATAIECVAIVDSFSGGCRGLETAARGEEVRTRPLHIDGLHTTITDDSAVSSTASRSGFVLIADAPGETDVEVREQAAEFTLHVEVIDSDAAEAAPAD